MSANSLSNSAHRAFNTIHSLGPYFFRKMASNQTNCLQSLDSSVEEFMDRKENKNAKKKNKHDVVLFLRFLVSKGKIR